MCTFYIRAIAVTKLPGVKMEEIVDLLVGAGYGRAGQEELAHYDRIVVGMFFLCEQAVGTGGDKEELEFQAVSSMKAKIMMAESIQEKVAALHCPLPLHAHQVQGLDFESMLPVVRWLVIQIKKK